MELEEILAKEAVLWRERPEEFSTLDKAYKPSFILRTIICSILAVGLTVAYLLYTHMEHVSYLALFVLWIICAYSVLKDFFDAGKLRKAEYLVTENYAIFSGKDIYISEKKRLGNYQFKTDEAGQTAFLAGKAIEEKATKWRMITVSEPILEEGAETYTRFAFYGVKDVEGLKAALEK